jgi:hypothetical protein
MNKVLTLFFILAVILFGAGKTGAQELDDIVTDRPDQTESAVTVPKGFIQIEAGVNAEYEDNEFNIGSTNLLTPYRKHQTVSLSSPGLLARYGLTKNIELRFGAEYLSEIEHIESSSIFFNNSFSKWSWSPITVGAKAKLLNEKGLIPNTALLVHLAIPLGDYAFQTDYISPSFRFAFSHQLSERFAFSYNLGYEWELNKNSTVGTGIYTASLGISLVKNLSMFLETYGFFTKGETPDHRFDGGFTYLVTPNVQADVSAGIGLNSISPDYFFGGGVSFRLPR